MRPRFQPSSSFEMLLDTMCNAFGGIILIALLLTLLTRQSQRIEADPADINTRIEQQTQELRRAEEGLRVAQEQQDELKDRIIDPGIAGILETLQERARLRRELELTHSEERGLMEEIARAEGESRTQLEAGVAEMLEREESARQAREAARQETESLRQQVSARQDSVGEVREVLRATPGRRTRSFRFPREHDTTRQPWHLIIRYGRFYPLYFQTQTSRVRNEVSLTWRPGLGEEMVVVPQIGLGLDPATAADAIRAALANVSPQTHYLVYQVYEDSFGEFLRARETLQPLGFEVSWVPLRNSVDLVIRPGTTEPPPRPL